MTVSVVVFDMDDTLYLERNYVRSGLSAVGDHVEQRFGSATFAETAWRLFEAGERSAIIDRALVLIGLGSENGLAVKLIELYRSHAPVIALEDDAEAALAAGPQIFDAIALLTDGRASTQRLKIDALNLSARFDKIVLTDELGGQPAWKPNSVGFRRIETHFGASGTSLACIGDNPRKDFLAPAELGWKTVRVNREGSLHQGVVGSPVSDAAITVPDLRGFSEGDLRQYLSSGR